MTGALHRMCIDDLGEEACGDDRPQAFNREQRIRHERDGMCNLLIETLDQATQHPQMLGTHG